MTSSTPHPVPEVLYIAAAPRSGTTIVSLLLGERPGFFNAGEVRFLWRQLAKPGRCGCGADLADCEVWRPILAASTALSANGSLAALVRGARAHSLLRTLPASLIRRAVSGTLPKLVDDHAHATMPVYAAALGATGARILVDSSKSPSYAYALAVSRGVRLKVLHLVRDPRAVVFSDLRDGRTPPQAGHRVRADAYRALKWTAWNLFIECFVRPRAHAYARMRYEDFAADPDAQLRTALRRLDADDGGDEAQGRRVDLRVNHTVFGNGMRFRRGDTVIAVDRAWEERMRMSDRAVVTALTWPLTARYRTRRVAGETVG
ncbi:MAG: sulfotransferase [Candidatus Dormibacteraeota bacterium]|nr:sulfotransferase [Candidatus Dormibacteraeota bacterium]MBV9525591.1 sulfotransferase [Candidatus Dormibacteraeota bacterium]